MQNLGEVEQFKIMDELDARLDFGEGATGGVPSGALQFCGQLSLAPLVKIPLLTNLRADDVVKFHWFCAFHSAKLGKFADRIALWAEPFVDRHVVNSYGGLLCTPLAWRTIVGGSVVSGLICVLEAFLPAIRKQAYKHTGLDWRAFANPKVSDLVGC